MKIWKSVLFGLAITGLMAFGLVSAIAFIEIMGYLSLKGLAWIGWTTLITVSVAYFSIVKYFCTP